MTSRRFYYMTDALAALISEEIARGDIEAVKILMRMYARCWLARERGGA